MVVLFPLTATGTDIREATAALEKATGELRAKIVELGAAEDSIRTDAIRLHQATEDASRRMLAQMRSSLSSRPGSSDTFENAGTAGAAAVELVTVATTLRGTWSLEGSTPAEALASSWELQKAIRDAEVMPKGTQEGLSPEEQEVLEEARMFDDSAGDENSSGPVYVFLNSVTPVERAQLLKDAFEKAAENARETAAVIGRAAGTPVSIRTMDGDPNDQYAQYRYQMGGYESVGPVLMELKSRNPLLMFGLTPSELSYQVSVRCGFELTNLD
jgi:hypothetical protein